VLHVQELLKIFTIQKVTEKTAPKDISYLQELIRKIGSRNRSPVVV